MRTEPGFARRVIIRQHGDYNGRTRRSQRRSARNLSASLRQPFSLLPGAVIDGERKASLSQVTSHSASHRPCTQKRYPLLRHPVLRSFDNAETLQRLLVHCQTKSREFVVEVDVPVLRHGFPIEDVPEE